MHDPPEEGWLERDCHPDARQRRYLRQVRGGILLLTREEMVSMDAEPSSERIDLQLTAGEVNRAVFMKVGGGAKVVSASFGELVLGCIEADFCNQIFTSNPMLR